MQEFDLSIRLGSHSLGVRSCFLPLLIQTPFILMHYIAYDPALFINGKRSVAESHTEDRKYLCRFHPCDEILKRLYEIFETGKKQDLPPWLTRTFKCCRGLIHQARTF